MCVSYTKSPVLKMYLFPLYQLVIHRVGEGFFCYAYFGSQASLRSSGVENNSYLRTNLECSLDKDIRVTQMK